MNDKKGHLLQSWEYHLNEIALSIIGVLTLVFTLTLIVQESYGRVDPGQDYITHVQARCPEDGYNVATLHVLTDLEGTQPYALCKDGHMFAFSKDDVGSWGMNPVLKGNPRKQCVFNRKDDSQTYVLHVYVPLTGGIIIREEAPKVITCTYDNYGERESPKSKFSDSKQPLVGILSNQGRYAKSKIDVYLTDVQQKRLVGKIRLGRYIQLRAELIGNYSDEVGLQAIGCQAEGMFGSYEVLIAGCGDGAIIKKTQGFTAKGRTTASPYFRAFKLVGSSRMNFRCTFIICEKNCDGSSCHYVENPLTASGGGL
ncbi:vitelline envelope sperm lysin receptor-like isoform X2 [Haliotis rubra]|uniref:vitelline envelope sperm lysin receptor-like isoform X2 n=1 Tax=Haliotis rubra TaxID=36100 RepID=UPI001EE54591|nr:vitelline envelope sperm lysin receptor-like isoform X2 [Haliotis rubra]